MSLGDPNESQQGGSGVIIKKIAKYFREKRKIGQPRPC